MSIYFLYTGETKEEARQKCQANLDQINANFEALGGGVFGDNIEEMTANPVINEVTYYYGVEKPPQCAMTNVVFDLQSEFNVYWKLLEEQY